MASELIWDRATGPSRATILFAHGAGAPMDTPFMDKVASELAATTSCDVARFEFPYMAERRQTGKRRPPDRQPLLLQTWRDVAGGVESGPIILAGKSMGGRMATLVAEELNVEAVLCFGYPFHPPKKPEKLRTEHLGAFGTPLLVCQGERDPMGSAEEVATYDLSANIRLHWAPDGDHDLKPRKKSGHSHDGNLAAATAAAAAFLKEVLGT